MNRMHCGAMIILLCHAGCRSDADALVEKNSGETITLGTTTSTQDSGLLDMLVPRFEKQSSIEVKVVAVGSGQALELGRRGDADVLLTHSPVAEDKFMSEGFGEEHRRVMYNDFVLVGPRQDVAALRGSNSATAALQRIAASQAPFVSRSDDSGTHQKEQQLWSEAGIEPAGDWYIKTGSGMAQSLRVANEKQAYILSDRATLLTQRDRLDLTVFVEGDPRLRNQYSVITVSQKKHAHVKHEPARKFADFLLQPDTQAAIAQFGRDKFGEPLFFCNE